MDKLQICVVDATALMNNEDCDFVFYDFKNFRFNDSYFMFDLADSSPVSNSDFYPFVEIPLVDKDNFEEECYIDTKTTYCFKSSRFSYLFVWERDRLRDGLDEYLTKRFKEGLSH